MPKAITPRSRIDTPDDSGFEAGYRLPTLADRVRRRRQCVSHDRQSRPRQRNHYDAAGRTVKTIQNYDANGLDENGLPVAADTDCDVTVTYQYDSFGRLATMTAYDANGTTVTPETTTYLYTSPINASWQTGVVYPDDTTGHLDRTSTAYDRLGRTTSTTDQRGVVHSYSYDSAGRLSEDAASAGRLGRRGSCGASHRHDL